MIQGKRLWPAPGTPGTNKRPLPQLIDGRYRVIRQLGDGRAARTLLCEDLTGSRKVVVKQLCFAQVSDWKHLELFEREARMLAALEHPGIPRGSRFFRGVENESTLYLVQQYIDGPDLLTRLEQGPILGEEEVFDITIALLDILEYLHGRTPPVLHRDIKPSNIVLRQDGQPVLVDFGGVRHAWQMSGRIETTVIGTSGYMPPEQLLGQEGPPADLYALGATLLHLITGVPPYAFPFESGRIEVPSDLPVRAGLQRLIEALLRPVAAHRPPSARDAKRVLLSGSDALGVGARRSDQPAGFRRSRAHSGRAGPLFIDPGPPPRDPHGPLAHVYRNLIDPLHPTRSPVTPGLQTWHRFEYAFVSLATLGIIPFLYGAKVRSRRRRYRHLFEIGEFTPGWIISVRHGDNFSICTYEFDVGGLTYRDQIDYWTPVCRFWSEGDPVAVLFDADTPAFSCMVFG